MDSTLLWLESFGLMAHRSMIKNHDQRILCFCC